MLSSIRPDYNRLQAECKARGLWIVLVGEVEGFCKSAGGHGPRWVREVLSRDLAGDPELEEARKFVGQVWGRVKDPSATDPVAH
jgi:hypothetical protein